MCSDPVDPGGEVRSCYVGCILGMPEISPFVFIIAASRYMGFLELKKSFFKRGCLGCGGIRVFLVSDKHDRRYMSVRVACGFTLMKALFPDAWMANEKGAAGGMIIRSMRGTSVRVALLFERAGGTSKPGPPLAARNNSSVHGAISDGVSLLW